MKLTMRGRAVGLSRILPACGLVGACASAEPHVHLQPGTQIVEGTVDLETGSVIQEQEGVVVSVQAAMLPGPRDAVPHPTFWVTVENNREGRVTVIPASARLVDTFGDQHSPLPLTVDGAHGGNLRYALVDPEVHTYVSLHFGWPYYPIYPYRGWVAQSRFRRVRPWHFDPFWTLGIGPLWIHEIRSVRPRPRIESAQLDREEIIYRDARLTYVVIFPEIDRAAREVRLILPAVGLRDPEGTVNELEFEMVFDQLVEVDPR